VWCSAATGVARGDMPLSPLSGTRSSAHAQTPASRVAGTNLTVRLLFQLARIVRAEAVPVDLGEGFVQLKAGRIDAVIYADYPVRVPDDQPTSADGLALITITNNRGAGSLPPRDEKRWP
jgi:hypothetical protein